MGKNNLRLSSGNSITKSRSSQTKRGGLAAQIMRVATGEGADVIPLRGMTS
jgi:hypothetical protein